MRANRSALFIRARCAPAFSYHGGRSTIDTIRVTRSRCKPCRRPDGSAVLSCWDAKLGHELYDAWVLSALVMGVCAIAAIALRNRPDVIVLVYTTLWILIPHVVTSFYIDFGIHPATFFVLFGLATTILTSSQAIRDAWSESVVSAWGVYAALTAFLVLAGLSQAFADNIFRGLPIALEQIIAPLAAFAVARCALFAGQNLLRRSLWLILLLAAAEAILALAQRAIHRWIPFEAFYSQQFVDASGRWERYGGTLDHPLALGLLLAIATWCLWVVPWAGIRLGLGVLFLAGIGMTQSRTGLVIAVAGFVVIVAFAPLSTSRDIQSSPHLAFLRRATPIAVVSIFAFFLWRYVVEADIIQRLLAGDGSDTSRQSAYSVFFDNLHELLFWGGGSSSNFIFAQQHGSPVSFENPFMQYTADFGMLAALLYFGAQLTIAVRAFLVRQGVDSSRLLAMTAMVAIAGTQAFSSLAAPGATAMLLWFILALASGAHARGSAVTTERPAPSGVLSPSLRRVGRDREEQKEELVVTAASQDTSE